MPSPTTDGICADMQAVIFLSASSISMLVTSRNSEGGKARILDTLSQPIDLAHEIFSKNRLTRNTMDLCVRIINEYQNLLEEYRLAGPVQIELRASNIFLDISNLDTLINRVHIACQLRIQVMDDGEMTRLLYLHARSALNQHKQLKEQRVLLLHVGPGNTRVMVFEQRRLTYYARYRTGSYRTAEILSEGTQVLHRDEPYLIAEHLRGVIEDIGHDYVHRFGVDPDNILILTPEFQRIRGLCEEEQLYLLSELNNYIEEVAQSSINQRVERYGLHYANVRSHLPTLIFYQLFAQLIGKEQFYIYGEKDDFSYLRTLMPSQKQSRALEKEVLHFSRLLATRFVANNSHGDHVTHLCKQLFDQLQDLHRLQAHDRLLLQVAAILHEVGSYINPKSHHHHSQYIILNSEHFGLSRVDVEIIALLARYHRHGAPTTKLRLYAEMEEKDRLRVQKLAALLRVADAMERSHASRIMEFSVQLHPKLIEIVIPDVRDLSMENISLRSKGDLFTDIFGYDIVLVAARSN